MGPEASTADARDALSVNQRAMEAGLAASGVVPVLAVSTAASAPFLADALLEGGLRCAEIPVRTPAAAAAVEAMRTRFPELLVGAGTILSTADADAALNAGAQFAVAPGTDKAVIDHVRDRDVPMIPGAMTPTEVETLIGIGITCVKFFPAEAAGGVDMLKALGGPFPMVRFVPTGGLSLKHLTRYLRLRSVTACGGSWMASREQIAAGDWAAIREASQRAVAVIQSAREAPPPS